MSGSETPLFFDGHSARLFGVFHAPAANAARVPFLFCHPFGEEKLWTHRTFVTYARHLAKRGHPVLRFDLAGAGDSCGALADTSLDACLADIEAAAALLRSRAGASRIGLLGIRLGATLASLAAESMSDVSLVVLWAPIVDGARYIQDLLRANLTTQMASFKAIRQDREAMVAAMAGGRTVNVDGYEMGHSFYTTVSAINLRDAPKRYAGPCLIVPIERQPDAVPPDLHLLGLRYPLATVRPVQEEPFWKEIARFYDRAPNLFSVTDQWIEAQQ